MSVYTSKVILINTPREFDFAFGLPFFAYSDSLSLKNQVPDSFQINEEYAAVMFENKVQIHVIDNDDGQTSEERESRLFPSGKQITFQFTNLQPHGHNYKISFF